MKLKIFKSEYYRKMKKFFVLNIVSYLYRCHPGQKPILIFDVMSFVKLLCNKFKIEIFCGGRNWMYTEYLNKLFAGFLQLNVELVFILDGFVQNEKYETWAQRQNKKYHRQIKIMNMVNDEMDSSDILKKFDGDFYTNTVLGVIEESCKKFGTLIYAVDEECDQEIARLAMTIPRVMGVFSDDTDYLIFSGTWHYYSTKFIDAKKFTTKCYSRSQLRKHFHLNSYQLAMFATFVGNDFVRVSELRMFHKRLMNNSQFENKDLLQRIAKLIRKHSQTYHDSHSMIASFARLIFQIDDPGYVAKLEKSINFYRVQGGLKSPVDNFLLRNHNIFTYNVLNENPINFSLVFSDLRMGDLKNYLELALPMFQRQAGAILKMNSIEVRKLLICSKATHSSNYMKIETYPVFPDFEDIPSMYQIMSNDPKYDNYRFAILKWTIDWNKLKDFNIEILPDEYVMDLLTIIFLKQRGVVSWKESDILLWTVKNVNNKMIPKSLKPPRRVDPRAFRIVFLYGRTYANIARCIEVAGLKKRYGVSCIKIFKAIFELKKKINFYIVETTQLRWCLLSSRIFTI